MTFRPSAAGIAARRPDAASRLFAPAAPAPAAALSLTLFAFTTHHEPRPQSPPAQETPHRRIPGTLVQRHRALPQ
ncbi:hypothetical protein BCEN4_780013 [Burkholderia cenocepacia]|nr:hypothetical protein BCEN4_780013 [Burkholderia cenocepacia]